MVSDNVLSYFENISKNVEFCYGIAKEARKRGYDSKKDVEVLLAKDLSERVESLISVVAPQIKGSGVSERIKELEKKYGLQDWRVALSIAEEVAKEKFCKFSDKREAMEVGIRLGFAYVTVGVVSSPLEGFVRLELKRRKDGKDYFCLYYSGPIRSAGGTGASVSVIIADYIRKIMGYSIYDPDQLEIKRTHAELEYYHSRIANLQYFPSREEAEFLTKVLPVQIDGDPSEDVEVPNYRDLPRINTNRLRNGFCLVIADCLILKAPKLWKQLGKWGKDFSLEHWAFFEDLLKIQKEKKAKGQIKSIEQKVTPDYTYIKDVVAGRPILGHPLESGGFRLRYGRTRSSGFSSDAIHPATMFILDNYIAIGTQLKVERPGKATTLSSCDTIEGPIVKLKKGDVVFIESVEQAKALVNSVEEILYVGDILISYGDFLNRAHTLVPPGYCEEWWALEVEKFEKIDDTYNVDFNKLIELSLSHKVPLHPKYTYHWNEITKEQFFTLIDWLSIGIIRKDKIILPLIYDFQEDILGRDPKRALELLGVSHKIMGDYAVIEDKWATALALSLGFYEAEFDIKKYESLKSENFSVLDLVNSVSFVKLRDKSGLYIGARMGRPEKSKQRKLTGSPHVLFPVGKEGGRLRSFQESLEKGIVTADFPVYFCSKCNLETIYSRCEVCDSETERRFFCKQCGIISRSCGHEIKMFYQKKIDINHYFKYSLLKLGLQECPNLIKGVRGLSSKEHIPENLIKGILRALFNIYVNKDGTTRYDMTEMTLTHFIPCEINVSIEKLRELGYTRDIFGNDLINENQIVELKCQDIILPSAEESFEEGADIVLYKVACFLDELLEKFYGLKGFYNLKDKKDLIGHLVVGLSPHTSAGIVGRIIGFSKTQGFFAHPLFHSAMRRDCDGDEACVMLLMDALLNFSRSYLGEHRGASQDEPLVLTSILIPSEVDDMVFDMDTCWKYPLEFYEACLAYGSASDVKIERYRDRLGKDSQFSGLGFTHNVSNINNGVLCSRYKTIPTMEEKVLGQMALAEKIRAVDESDVARLIIERHFMRDIKGNLRKFSTQQFRCVNCNEKYRRPPLRGVCVKCGGKIIFTVSEGSVIKYLKPSISLAEKYELPSYLRQSLELAKQMVDLVFGKDAEKQEGLGKWF